MLSLLRSHRWQILIFLTEFVYMGVELVASRVMSPTFGTTLNIWSAIIGTILASSALGNWLAGRISDDVEKRETWIVRSLLICAFWLGLVPTLFQSLVDSGIATVFPVTVAALIVCVVLFLVPGVCIGSLSPLVLAQNAYEQELEVGAAGSSLYTAMTLGGLIGTFAAGFWLVPFFGSEKFVFLMADACLLLAIAAAVMLHKFMNKKVLWPAVGTAVLLVSMFVLSTIPSSAVGVDVWRDTQYGRAHVMDGFKETRPLRNLLVSGGYESAMYLDDTTYCEPVFEYIARVCNVVDSSVKEDDKVLCLGGGAYSAPKWIASNCGTSVEVIEIDAGITGLANEYFHVQEVSDSSKHGIVTHEGDARVVMPSLGSETYSVVFNDTFAGEEPAVALSTVEAAREVKSRLKPDGIYISNVIGTFDGADDEFLGWEVKTLKEVFGYVHVYAVYDSYAENSDLELNWVVVATDNENWKAPDDFIEVDIAQDKAEVLTDDDCPVEYLVARMKMRDR